jgi:DNA polymerase elongation subunit (family B)
VSNDAKTAYIDIETAPNLAYVWGLYKETIPLERFIESGRMLSFAWKWRGEPETFFASEEIGHRDLVAQAREVMHEADVLVHYNGKRFDVPHLNREILLAGMAPPAPYRQLDLYETVKKRFRFPSNKLAHVSQALGLEGKVQHSGFSLWVRCMEGDPAAWREMEEYNRRDVTLLEELHDKLMPWLVGTPNAGLTSVLGEDVCPHCGSADLVKEGFAYTQVGAFQRYHCKGCGAWSRSGKRSFGVDIRPVAAG